MEVIFKSLIVLGCLGWGFWIISKGYLEFIISTFVEEDEMRILKEKFSAFTFDKVYLYLLRKAKAENYDNLMFHLKIYYYLNGISFYLTISCAIVVFLFYIFFSPVEKGWIIVEHR